MIKKIFYGIVTTGIRTLSGIVRNKIYAMVLSLNLFGILSIGVQSSGLLFTFIAFGIPLGVTTVVAGLVTRPDGEKVAVVSRIVVLVLGIANGVFLLISVILLVAPEYVSRLITANDAYSVPIAWILLSTPLMVIENCLYSIMEGMGKLREIVLFKMIPAIVIIPILYVLTTRYFLVGAAVSVFVHELLLCIAAFVLLRKLITFDRDAFRVIEIFRSIFKVALLSFIIGTLRLATDFIAKRYVLGAMGEAENGIIQSVSKITDLYPLISLAWLSMHLFPTIGAQKENAAAVARTVERTAVVAVVMIIPVILLLFAFRSLVLELMFKKDFLPATEYLGAMLASGILRIYALVLGVGLLAAGFRRQWFIASLLTTAVYFVGIWIGFLFGLGIYALPLAFGVGLGLQAVYAWFAFRKELVAFDPQFVRQSLIFGLFTILLVASVFWSGMLVILAAGYLLFLFRYNLIQETRVRVYEFLQKAAP